MTTPYTTGSVTLTNGSAVVIGAGTAWQTALIAGGTLYVEADGNPLPILSVDSNTQITAAIKWKGASGSYPYAIMRDTAYGQQTVANAQALSTYLQRLDNASLAALASLAASMTADKFAYATGLNSMAWATLTAFARETLALGSATAIRDKILAVRNGGPDGSGDQYKVQIGWHQGTPGSVWPALKGRVDAQELGRIWTDLTVQQEAATLRAALGAQAALGFTPVQQGGGAGQGVNKVYLGWDNTSLRCQVDGLDLGRVWTTHGSPYSTAQNGYLKLANGFIIQWGKGSTGAGDYRQLFPIAFPGACFSVAGVMDSGAINMSTLVSWTTSNIGLDGFDVRARSTAGGPVGGAGNIINWIAIGG